MGRFTLPRDIYYGKGCLDKLKEMAGRRAFIVVGGGSMKRLGFLDRAVGYLREAGMETRIFDNVEPDPSVETVRRGAAAMRDFEPDLIVAMGGGSPIDAAKTMWVFYEHPETTFEALLKPFSFPKLRQKARFVAVPSTSGTATEVTAFAVITDYETGIKYPLADYQITPDAALVDPELATSMPKELTAHTGMDALTHAMEAFVSRRSSPFTDPLALEACRTVFASLPASYAGDGAAREQMHYAQCLAGMAFSNALLGIVHSLAHKTGAIFEGAHIPHGCANAMYLPYVIRFNAREAAPRYAKIAEAVGIAGENEAVLVSGLVEKIADYNVRLNIPRTLRAWGVPEAEFQAKATDIAREAVGDACTGSNPRRIDAAAMEKLLNAIYYGTTVDF